MSTVAKAFLTDTQSARMDRILGATRQLLGDAGADRMTMRDIAAASGVSAATLYNRFGTKDNLTSLAVVDYFEHSINAVIDAHAKAQSPVEKIVYGLHVLAAEILQAKMFAHALISTYFKIDNERQMPDRLNEAVHATWRPIIEEMDKKNLLQEWISRDLLTDEISDRVFASVMKWAQGGIPDKHFGNRMVFSVLSMILGVSRGKQIAEVTRVLTSLPRHD